MLRRDRQIRMQIHQLADACLFALSFRLAYVLRADPQICAWLHTGPIAEDAFLSVVWIFIGVMIGGPFILESQGFYNRSPLSPRSAMLWPLFKGCLITTVTLVLVMYAFHVTSPRVVMSFFGGMSFGLIYLKEELLRQIFKSKISQSQYKRRFILVGGEAEIEQMCRELEGRKDETVAIVAQFNLGEAPLAQLVQKLHEHAIYGVILSARHTYFEQVENVIKACELEGVEVWLVADFFGAQISRTSFDELLGRPLLIFRTAPEASWQSVVKQLMDFFCALLVLVCLSWLFALLALLVKLTSPGPVFFRQPRSGQSGAPFTVYKFRTMVTNAEQIKHQLNALNEMRGPVFKVTNDPRITPLGKFLRKYSLDELPQFYNVLRGDMSLVGPRPLDVNEVKRFDDLAYRRRFSVKPGLTGLLQISGRNQIIDFKDWIRLDLEYIDNWSLWLDVKILLLTVPAVLRGTGAK